MNVRRIFHPTDFSPCADAALRFALQLALRFDADLYVGHVTDGRRASNETSADPEYANLIARLRRSASTVPSELFPTEAKMPRIDYEIIHHEKPAAGIVDFAAQHDIDLLVMGTHGGRAIRRFLLGSVALKVLHMATTNVAVVPGSNKRGQADRILVPVDLRERSIEHVAAAVALGRQFDLELDVLHVLDLPERSQYVPADASLSDTGSLSEAVSKYLNVLTQPSRLNASLTSHVISGRPAETILEYIDASKPRLVVMASCGMSPAERIRHRYKDIEQEGALRWVIGPVTERVVTHSPVPVVVLKRFSDASPRVPRLSLSESSVDS